MTDVHSDLFHDSSRYKLIRQLGAGGMGVVYEVFDRERELKVALKTHKHRSSNALYRFKREFRALADISHPNLVTLYELVVEGDTSFYTMELLDGVDFVTFCTKPSKGEGHAFDEQKLRLGLSQLAAGLSALHSAGKLHRDIKPSNVMVTKDNRVVILDFGLVAAQADDDMTETMHGAGTHAYMAPEQSSFDSELTRAADMYSLGVVLFQALTGELPFSGTAYEVGQAKITSDPIPPKEMVPGVPEDLNQLCMELLSRDASIRPTAEQVEQRVGYQKKRPTPPSIIQKGPAEKSTFVGRSQELDLLDTHYQRLENGQFCLALIRGESGMGKTALAREFLELCYARDPSVMILHGRCYERETVPYKAVDSLIDNLSREWREMSHRESIYIVPKDADLLSKLFPVLDRVSAVASAPKPVRKFDDVRELRSRGFEALRETFQRLGEIRKLVLFLDDLQWVDLDTVNLLLEVTKQPKPPAMMLILASRFTEEESSPLERLMEQSQDVALRIDLKPLERAETEEMARCLVKEADDSAIESFVRESKGNPFFVEQYAEAMGREETESSLPTLEALLLKRIDRLTEEEKDLLDVLSLAGQPMDQEVVAKSVGVEKDLFLKARKTLSAAKLISTAPGGKSDQLIPYHDRIRSVVVKSLDRPRKQVHHQAIAEAMEELYPGAQDEIALHYAGAGKKQKAAAHALEAAKTAEKNLSFDRAARFYHLCLEAGEYTDEETSELRAALGQALANAGRGVEAAKEYLAAARNAEPAKAMLWQEKGAYQLLGCGRIDEGIAELGPVLNFHGIKMPKSQGEAIVEFLKERALLKLTNRGLKFSARPENEIEPDILDRIDSCWSAATGLMLADTVRAQYFLIHHLRLALSSGELFRISRTLSLYAISETALNGSKKKIDSLLERANVINKKVNQPYLEAFHALSIGLTHFIRGQWKAASDSLSKAVAVFRQHCPESILEIHIAEIHLCTVFYYLGRMKDLKAQVKISAEYARKKDNLFALVGICSNLSNAAWLVSDNSERAEREALEAMNTWTQQGVHLQHAFTLCARMHIELYRGNLSASWQMICDRWKPFTSSGLLRNITAKIILHDLRARAAIGAACQQNDKKQPLSEAKKSANALMRLRRPWATGFGEFASAQIDAAEGRNRQAIAKFHSAGQVFESVDMALHAAAAKYAEGKLLGGTEGQNLMNEAHRYLEEQEVVKNEQFLGIFIPYIIHGM